MVVSEMVTRIKRLFGDESGAQITDDDIYRWITDAQEEIIRQNQTLLQTIATTSSVANQSTYTLPTDLMTLHAIEYNGIRIKGYNLSEFETRYNGWDSPDLNLTGTPCNYTIWANNFMLLPTPDTSVADIIKIYYTKKPTPITSDIDALSLPTQYHKTIVDLCLSQAYELDEDWESSQVKATKAQQDIDTLRNDQNIGERVTYPTITVLPEDL